MKYSNSIEYNISTKVDNSGLTKLQNQIKQLELSLQHVSDRELIDGSRVDDAREQLRGLSTALTNAFNPTLGILDLTKFRAELDKNNVSASQLTNIFKTTGAEGQKVLGNLTKQIANFNGGVERTSSAVDKIFNTFSNTFRWGLVSSFWSQFLNAIHSSVDYAKELDESLTQIMLVTDYSRDSMNEYAKSANEAAKAVGQTTVGMTNASLIFAQQGYDLEQSQQLATLSAKLANASQQDTAATSDQITAYMNAYGLSDSIEELTQAMDNWALIANISAADVQEIAVAAQKSASMANAVGVSGEALAAQIATIESVTRDAPEQIGNGLKTLYARFSDLQMGGEDEEGVSLGDVTATLDAIGVKVLDSMGNVRTMDAIMEDLMVVWDDLDQTTKTAAAQSLAGKYQINRFEALMNNADMYQEYKEATGAKAAGTLDIMNEEKLDSWEGKVTKLQASLEGLFNDVLTTDAIYPFIDAVTDLVNVGDTLFESLGKGSTILLGIATLFGKIFNQNIARSINDTMTNMELGNIRKNNVESTKQTLERSGVDTSQGVGKYISDTADPDKLGAYSTDQYNTYQENVDNWVNASVNLTAAEQNLIDTTNLMNGVFQKIADTSPFLIDEREGTTYVEGGQEALTSIDITSSETQEKIKNVDFSNEIQITKDLTFELNKLESQLTKIGETSNKESTEFKEDLIDVQNQISKINRSAFDAEVWTDLPVDKVQKLKTVMDQANKELEETKTVSEGTKKEIIELARELGVLNQNYQELNSQDVSNIINDGGRTLEAQAIEVNFQRVAEAAAQEKAIQDQANITRQQSIKNFLDLGNAAMSFVFACQAAENIGHIITNEDLSLGEKFTQIITNVVTVLPQLVMALQTIKSFNFVSNITQISKFANKLKDLAVGTGTSVISMKEFSAALKNINWESKEAQDLLSGLSPTIGKAMAAAAAEGATGVGILGAGFKALAVDIYTALAPLLPFIAAAAVVVGGIAWITALVDEHNKALEEAKENALQNLEELKQKQKEIQELRNQINNINTLFTEYDGTNGEGIIEQANETALAMKELGRETEAAEIHLAAVKAEASGTAEDFENLVKKINQAGYAIEAVNYTDIIEASAEVLRTQDANFEDLIQDQIDLRHYTGELNNLDPWDPNYAARKQELEDLIQILKDTIDGEKEAADAAMDAMNAQGALAGINALNINRNTEHVSGERYGIEPISTSNGDQTIAMSADAETLRDYFSATVQGFDVLTSLEQLDFMLQNIRDDSQKAAIEIQQLLEQNQSLGIRGYAGQMTDDYAQITSALEMSDFTAQQSLTLIASLDENASKSEILRTIDDIRAEMNANGNDFSLALMATLNEESLANIEDQVRDAISEMGPIDADLDEDIFKATAQYFQEMAGEIEGIPEEIKYSAEELEEFTEAILRYEDALKDADENLENWIKTLNDSNSSISEQIEALEGLRDLFGDLLGIDTSNLSNSFMQNAEVLKLLDAALYGTAEEADKAYNQLNILANLDMAGLLNWENGIASLNDRFYELQGSIDNLGVDAAYTIDMIQQLMNGTITAPEIDATQFVAGLQAMVDAGEMSVEEAIAAMDGAQIEADVTTVTQEADNVNQAVDWYPESTEPLQISAENVPVAFDENGVHTDTATGFVRGWEYKPQVETSGATQETTVSSVAYSANKNGNGTGKVSFSNARQKVGGSGSAKRSVTTPSGQHSRPTTSSGSGGSGGKGGSGGSSKSIATKEKKEHQKDYYEEVDHQLSKIQKVLDGVQKSEDRLIGREAQANQKKQLELLAKEIKLHQTRLKILQTEELRDVQNEVNQIWQAFSNNKITLPAIEYDEDGIISNYEEISDALDKWHNYLVDRYNAAAAAGYESYCKTLEEWIKGIDDWGKKLLSGMSRFDDIQVEVIETNNIIAELQDSIEDLRIEMVRDILDAADQVAELNERYAELQGFLTGLGTDSSVRKLTRDMTELYKTFGDMTDGSVLDSDSIFADTKAAMEYYYNTVKNAKNGQYGEYGENTAALREDALKTWDQAFNMAQKFQELNESIIDGIISGYDEIAEKQDRQSKKYERLANQVEQLSDAYSLVYGEDSYQALSELSRKQGEVVNSQLQSWKNYLATIQELYLDEEGNWNETWKQLPEDVREAIEDQMNEAEDTIRELALNNAELYMDAYEKAIEAGAQKILETVIGDKNFDKLDREWEWNSKYADKYRDEIERAYEIEKLRSSYNDLLNKSQGASLQTQNKIKNQMNEQLKYLQEQKTVSEYDVKLANSKLLLLEKQIALEDAQRNKNQMQLRRDGQGNYRYVYRASQDEVEKARQELLDAEQDLYEVTKQQAQKNYEDLKNYYKDYLNDRAEILKAHNGDVIAAADELATLTEQFKALVEGIMEDSGDTAAGLIDVLGNMAETGAGDAAVAAQNMLNQILDSEGNLKEETGILWVDLFDFVDDTADKTLHLTEEVGGEMVNIIDQVNKDIIGNESGLQEGSLNWLLNQLVGSGGILENISEALTGDESFGSALNDITDTVGELDSAATELNSTFEETINTTFTQAIELANNYKQALIELIELMDGMAPYLDAITNTYTGMTASNYPQSTESGDTSSVGEGTSGSGTPQQSFSIGDKVGYQGCSYWWSDKYGWYEATGIKDGKAYYQDLKGWHVYSSIDPNNVEIIDGPVTNDKGTWYCLKGVGWVTVGQLTKSSYDTGGYTGQWSGKDGKLALIHQKELILNAEDTKNVLAAVDIVRGITSTFGNALSTVSTNRMNASSAFGGDTIEQRVEIKAEFPNVRDSIEIENALINLADTAYQYAHRNI